MKKLLIIFTSVILIPILSIIWIVKGETIIKKIKFKPISNPPSHLLQPGGKDKQNNQPLSDKDGGDGESKVYLVEDDNIKVEALFGNDQISVDGKGYLLVGLTGKELDELAVKERQPLNISFVIDRSGSMSGEKLTFVKQAVKDAAEYLNDEDRISVVIYDDYVETVYSSQERFDYDKFVNRINRIQSGGSTNLEGGLREGIEEIKDLRLANYHNRLILLSDGLANVGVSDSEQLATIVQELVGEQIVVSTIGVGTDYDERLMTSVARAGNGNYYFLENPEQSSEIFAQELVDVVQLVASNVKVRLGSGDEIVSLRGVGYELEGFDSFSPNSLASNRQYLYLFEYDLKQTAILDGPIFELEVNYQDNKGNKQQLASLPITQTQVNHDVQVLADDRVYEEYIRTMQAEKMWSIYEKLDHGENKDAKKIADELVMELETANIRLDGVMQSELDVSIEKQIFIDELGDEDINNSSSGKIFQKSNQAESYDKLFAR